MSIEVKNISHTYSPGLPHQWKALTDVSLSISDGEFVGIIGHTGSGKSTLLQHLNGLLKPTSGTIYVGDIDITDKSTSMIDVRKNIGLVFQYPEYQIFEETVEKDVAYGPKNLGLGEVEIAKRVENSLNMVGLNFEEVHLKSPFDLSGGQRRRVAIAGVIAMEPEVLILDEPTAGLDPQAHQDILAMIREFHQKGDNIIILVSHNMNDIVAFSDKVIVMDKGEVALYGTPSEVFSKKKELETMGLDLPDITKITEKLRDKKWDLPTGVFSMEEAEEVIYEKIMEKLHD